MPKYAIYDTATRSYIPFDGPRLWKPHPCISDDNPEARRQFEEHAARKPTIIWKQLNRKDIEWITSDSTP